MKKKILKKCTSMGTFITNLNSEEKRIFSKEDLQNYLYCLKQNLNFLIKLKIENLKIIDSLHNDPDYSTNNQIEIELGLNNKEKVIEEIRLKKENYKEKANVEQEYKSTLRKMVENEKLNLKKYNDDLLITQDKLNNIILASKILNDNYNANSKKNNQMNLISININEDIERMNYLTKMQNQQIEELEHEVNQKKEEIMKKKEFTNKKAIKLELDNKSKKEEIRLKIQEVHKVKNQKNFDDNYILKEILGLNLIQKYLIKGYSENQRNLFDKMKESEEYKIFIYGEFNEEIIQRQNSKINSSNPGSNKNNEKIKINLKKTREIFDSIDVGYETINDFYNKIINKQSFNRILINKFNILEVNLERKKENYSKRVLAIVSKRPKNIEELGKNNPILKSLITKSILKDKNLDRKKDQKYDFTFNSNIYDSHEKSRKLFEEIRMFFENFLMIFSNFKDINKVLTLVYRNFKKKINKIIYEGLTPFTLESGLELYFKEFEKIKEKLSRSQNSLNNNEIETFENLKVYLDNHLDEFSRVKLKNDFTLFRNLTQIESIEEVLTDMFSFTNNFSINSFHQSSQSVIINRNTTETDKLNKPKLSAVNSKERNQSQSQKLSKESSFNSTFREETPILHKKKIPNSKLSNIMKKLYDPYVEKFEYLRNLNEDFTKIQKNTRQSILEMCIMEKKQNQIEKMANELILYNNPYLNINQLSGNTYNKIAKKIISNQVQSMRIKNKRKSLQKF